VPNAQWNVGVDLTTASGFNLTSYLSVGKMPMNDQNSKYTDAYSLLDLKPVMLLQFKKYKATLSTGVNNLTNSRYAASILQCNGFGTTTILLSGQSTYYGGLAVSYLLRSSFILCFTFLRATSDTVTILVCF
jgi:iron complex outermembrane receptor protein